MPKRIKKIYIAGKITGEINYRGKFQKIAKIFEDEGYCVMNPGQLPDGFLYEDYMQVCFAMIDVCKVVYFLDDWEESPGAQREYNYCKAKNYLTIFQKEGE